MPITSPMKAEELSLLKAILEELKDLRRITLLSFKERSVIDDDFHTLVDPTAVVVLRTNSSNFLEIVTVHAFALDPGETLVIGDRESGGKTWSLTSERPDVRIILKPNKSVFYISSAAVDRRMQISSHLLTDKI